MLTILMAVLGNLLTIFPGGGAYLFTPPPPAEVTVRRGETVVIYNVRAYKPDRGCQPLPPVVVDAYPRPRLGAVSTSPNVAADDGPCGVRAYPIQTVTYTAGPTSGVESFRLYFYMNEGRRDQRAVHVLVR